MKEKIKDVKITILDRIKKAVSDETKPLSAETLKIMADIVIDFDYQEIKINPTTLSSVINKIQDNIDIKPKEVI